MSDQLTQARDRIAELEADNAALREAVRVLAESVVNEPELPGLMPDEMWEMLNGNRDMTQLALVRVVQATKEGIIKSISKDPLSAAAVREAKEQA